MNSRRLKIELEQATEKLSAFFSTNMTTNTPYTTLFRSHRLFFFCIRDKRDRSKFREKSPPSTAKQMKNDKWKANEIYDWRISFGYLIKIIHRCTFTLWHQMKNFDREMNKMSEAMETNKKFTWVRFDRRKTKTAQKEVKRIVLLAFAFALCFSPFLCLITNINKQIFGSNSHEWNEMDFNWRQLNKCHLVWQMILCYHYAFQIRHIKSSPFRLIQLLFYSLLVTSSEKANNFSVINESKMNRTIQVISLLCFLCSGEFALEFIRFTLKLAQQFAFKLFIFSCLRRRKITYALLRWSKCKRCRICSGNIQKYIEFLWSRLQEWADRRSCENYMSER